MQDDVGPFLQRKMRRGVPWAEMACRKRQKSEMGQRCLLQVSHGSWLHSRFVGCSSSAWWLMPWGSEKSMMPNVIVAKTPSKGAILSSVRARPISARRRLRPRWPRRKR